MSERRCTTFSIQPANSGILEEEIISIINEMQYKPKKVHMSLGRFKGWFELVFPAISELESDKVTDDILRSFKQTRKWGFFPLDIHHHTYQTLIIKNT